MEVLSSVDRSKLLDVIWSLQRKKRHISNDDVSKIAQEFNMSEVELEGVISFLVARRYRRLYDQSEVFPDLLLIDGGKGQLNAALAACMTSRMPAGSAMC